MRILLISRGVPSKKDPQYGCFEYDQAKALAKLGHNIIIASVDTRFRLFWRKWGLSISHLEDNIISYKLFICPSIFLRPFGNNAVEKFVEWQWKKIACLVQKREQTIDIIYSHYLFNSYYTLKCFTNINAPIVALEHWSAINQDQIAPNVMRMAEYTYSKVNQLLTVSEPLKQRIIDLFSVHPIVVHNMVGKEFHYMNIQSEKPITFITVGSLFPIKNHTLLIAAFAKLKLPKDTWQLVIVGEGSERKKLQNQIDKEGLSQNIHLIGTKPKAEIANLLNSAHVFVLPSISENFSVAVLEALACGLPVVASICGGIKECIDKTNGLLFEVGDLNGLARCLQFMYEHAQDYDRYAIATNCQARFASEVIAKQLSTIFENVKYHNKL